MEIYRRLRPGDPPTLETAQNLFNNLFFNPERYDLSKVGRLKLNYKFKLDEPLDNTVLTKRDILETVRYLIDLKNGKGSIDDIDHLGNRRVRAVGELMENQYRIGLVRMERAIKERMSMSQEIETLMPHDLINAKPVSAVVKEYFGSLAAVAVHGPDEPALRGHAQAAPLGPRAGRSDPRARRLRGARRARRRTTAASARSRRRKVRTSASSRRCRPTPASTSSASSRRRTARSRTARVTDEVAVLLGARRRRGTTSPRRTPTIDKKGKFTDDLVSCRHNGEFVMAKPEEVDADGRVAEPAGVGRRVAHPVPRERRREPRAHGLEHAAPGGAALRTAAPLVGTGIEGIVARDSGVTVVAKRDGVVESVDATRIVVRPTQDEPRRSDCRPSPTSTT